MVRTSAHQTYYFGEASKTYRMGSIAHNAGNALLPVGVGLVHPQSPGLDILTDGKVAEDLSVEIGVRGEQLLLGGGGVPVLGGVVSLVTGEEAVVGQESAAVARGQDNLVLVVVATPVLESAVLGVVHETQLDSLGGGHVGVQAAGVGRTLLRVDADDATDRGANAVSADDNLVGSRVAILKGDDASLEIDGSALQSIRNTLLCTLLFLLAS